MTSEIAVSASVEAENAPATEERTVVQQWTPGNALSVSIDEKERIEDRFWEKIDKQKDDACWPWNKARKEKGYGRFEYKGKTVHAHRMAYALTKGPIPDGMTVRHTCDNPCCCNPSHLQLGTTLENVNDMVSRGRHPRGERHGKSKLTTREVEEIRGSNETGNVLAESYGVHPSVISSIKRHKHWRPAAVPIHRARPRRYVRTMYAYGESKVGEP